MRKHKRRNEGHKKYQTRGTYRKIYNLFIYNLRTLQSNIFKYNEKTEKGEVRTEKFQSFYNNEEEDMNQTYTDIASKENHLKMYPEPK